MVSTPESIIENSPMSIIMSIILNNPSERKPLRQFSEVLGVKHKPAVRRLVLINQIANL